MWNLQASKNAFSGRNGFMSDRNFWWYVLKRQNALHLFSDDDLQKVLDWRPERSNCPEFEEEIIEMLGDVSAEVRNFLGGIFVGRTYSGDLNAEARQIDGSAWVAISLQYTSAVGAYIAAYDRYINILIRRQSGEPLPELEIMNVFELISLSRESWADEKKFAGAHQQLLSGPKERGPEFYGPFVLDAEIFVIGHELAHHLLGHTNKSAMRLRAQDEISELLEAQQLTSFVNNRPDSQSNELLSDVLGLKLASTLRSRTPTDAAYRTIIASICALLAEADVKHHWFLPKDDVYPSTTDRISLLLALMPAMFSTVLSKGNHDSARNLVCQMAGFATACLQASLYTRAPEDYRAPTWEQVAIATSEGSIVLATTLGDAEAFIRRPGWIRVK